MKAFVIQYVTALVGCELNSSGGTALGVLFIRFMSEASGAISIVVFSRMAGRALVEKIRPRH